MVDVDPDAPIVEPEEDGCCVLQAARQQARANASIGVFSAVERRWFMAILVQVGDQQAVTSMANKESRWRSGLLQDRVRMPHDQLDLGPMR
jgi:hypothetical protein